MRERIYKLSYAFDIFFFLKDKEDTCMICSYIQAYNVINQYIYMAKDDIADAFKSQDFILNDILWFKMSIKYIIGVFTNS